MNNFEAIIAKKTDEELVDIYMNSNDYQPDFNFLVEIEMSKRNIPTAPLIKVKSQIDESSDSKLKIGEPGNPLWIGLCFLSALLGGIIPIVAGYIYFTSKVKNSKGEEFYRYSDKTRKYGKIMLVVGVIVIAINLYFIGKSYL